jgi:hypothetical protein
MQQHKNCWNRYFQCGQVRGYIRLKPGGGQALGKLFKKVILKTVQRHIEEKGRSMQAVLVSVPVTAQYFNV